MNKFDEIVLYETMAARTPRRARPALPPRRRRQSPLDLTFVTDSVNSSYLPHDGAEARAARGGGAAAAPDPPPI